MSTNYDGVYPNNEQTEKPVDVTLIYYNFFRPHEALRDLPPKGLDKTPAQVAKADYPYKSWLDVIMGKTN